MNACLCEGGSTPKLSHVHFPQNREQCRRSNTLASDSIKHEYIRKSDRTKAGQRLSKGTATDNRWEPFACHCNQDPQRHLQVIKHWYIARNGLFGEQFGGL